MILRRGGVRTFVLKFSVFRMSIIEIEILAILGHVGRICRSESADGEDEAHPGSSWLISLHKGQWGRRLLSARARVCLPPFISFHKSVSRRLAAIVRQ